MSLYLWGSHFPVRWDCLWVAVSPPWTTSMHVKLQNAPVPSSMTLWGSRNKDRKAFSLVKWFHQQRSQSERGSFGTIPCGPPSHSNSFPVNHFRMLFFLRRRRYHWGFGKWENSNNPDPLCEPVSENYLSLSILSWITWLSLLLLDIHWLQALCLETVQAWGMWTMAKIYAQFLS